MRIVEIILTELAADRLKSEEKLQRIINDKNIKLDEQIKIIKETLDEIVKNDLMIEKWRAYTTPSVENNNK